MDSLARRGVDRASGVGHDTGATAAYPRAEAATSAAAKANAGSITTAAAHGSDSANRATGRRAIAAVTRSLSVGVEQRLSSLVSTVRRERPPVGVRP
jgi:hypothetical protein